MSYRFFLVTGPVFFVIVHFLSFLLLLPFLRFLLLLRRFRLFCLLTGKGRLFVCLFNTLVATNRTTLAPSRSTRIFRTERVTVGVATIRKERVTVGVATNRTVSALSRSTRIFRTERVTLSLSFGHGHHRGLHRYCHGNRHRGSGRHDCRCRYW